MFSQQDVKLQNELPHMSKDPLAYCGIGPTVGIHRDVEGRRLMMIKPYSQSYLMQLLYIFTFVLINILQISRTKQVVSAELNPLGNLIESST